MTLLYLVHSSIHNTHATYTMIFLGRHCTAQRLLPPQQSGVGNLASPAFSVGIVVCRCVKGCMYVVGIGGGNHVAFMVSNPVLGGTVVVERCTNRRSRMVWFEEEEESKKSVGNNNGPTVVVVAVVVVVLCGMK